MWETEIRRIVAQGQPGQTVPNTLLQNNQRLEVWLKCFASLKPCPTKKKKKEREMKINNHKTNKQKPTGKPGMVEQACTPSTGEVEAGGSRPAWASWFRI
jgi:hypothetical protein